VQLSSEQRGVVARNDYVARLLEVTDQQLFVVQLDEVMRALETDLEVRLAPDIGAGVRVKIKNGPLRGIEGWVKERHGMNTVLLRIDFIGQAAAVSVDATDLEAV
jgi:transcription antitermination factor NusG